MKKLMIFFLAVFFLTGCKGLNNGQEKECPDGFSLENGECEIDTNYNNTVFTSFTSSTDIQDLFTDFQETRSLIQSQFGWNFFATDDMLEDAAPTAEADGEKGSDDYSETNNQVEGVDELDNVLTDGKYIYISNWNKIQIVLAYTQASEYQALDLVKEITFEELQGDQEYFYPVGMYVDDERFLVIGSSYSYTCIEEGEPKTTDGEPTTDEEYYEDYCSYWLYESSTRIFEYNKDDFTLENEYSLSGYYVGTRKIGDDLYFVTNEYIPYYYLNNENIDFTLDDYLPSYKVNDQKTILTYDDIMYVEGTEPTNFTTFYGIDLETQAISSEVVLGEGGYNLYVSTENIYLTGTKYAWNDALLLDIEEDTVDEENPEDPYELTTSVLRIRIADGLVAYNGNTEVAGQNLDQFSMDEKDGFLRIVTTTNNWWWWGNEETNNRLTILDENLDQVSQIENIGKEGESVQSTRFVGNYAYIVTFLRTDPFYVFDLSDPYNPVKTAELEIPGFSDFLQPIGEDYILGIGYGDFEGGTQGLKISLYDVSDKTNAVVADEIVYPYSENNYMWTSTVYNHKDLLVSIDKGIIALPYTQNGYDEDTYHWTYNTGILVLNLDIENGEISERGRVEHSESNSYDTYVYKSKFISDFLYTISSKFVVVSTIADPETILEQLQIGESYEYDVPTEVEPTDPEVGDEVNPDATETGESSDQTD